MSLRGQGWLALPKSMASSTPFRPRLWETGSMASVVVRRASQSDLGALLALYEELAATKITAAPGDRATSEPLLAEILADPRRELVVALVDGQVVGTADLLIVPNLTYHGKPWVIVENVIVAGTARRTGAPDDHLED